MLGLLTCLTYRSLTLTLPLTFKITENHALSKWLFVDYLPLKGLKDEDMIFIFHLSILADMYLNVEFKSDFENLKIM